MPLRDHFHAPLADLYPWESFHAAWATEIMRVLNRSVLPANYFAAAQVHVGSRVGYDAEAFEANPSGGALTEPQDDGVAVERWAPPATALVMPAVFPDEIEVQVFRRSGGATLVAAIEAEQGNLPAACMRCGAEASVWKTKKFAWQPSWVAALFLAGLLPYLIVSLIMTKRMSVQVPLCVTHRNHWLKRVLFHLIALGGGFAFFIGLFVLLGQLNLSRQVSESAYSWSGILACFAALVWVVSTVVIESRMIGPAEITDRTITLKNVHPAFQDALARARLGDDEEGPQAPAPKMRPGPQGDQFYDPSRRRDVPG